MDFHQAVELVEESDKFHSFKQTNNEYYLVHGFCTIDKERSPWQVGYYSKKTKRIVVFTAAEEVLQAPAEEAFRESGHVPELRGDDVLVSLDDALKTADQLRHQQFSRELVNRGIVLLQTIDKVPMWNLTFITLSFNMLNIRIHAGSGEVVSSSLQSLMSLGSQV